MSQALTYVAPRVEIDWISVRANYESLEGTVKGICERHGITQSQLRRRRAQEGWKSRGERRVQQSTLIAVMFRVLYRQVLNLEKQMGDESSEKHAILLGTLAKTAEKLQELGKTASSAGSSDRKDIRDLRAKIATRIEQLRRE